ncbi:hypothetical protein PAHAL_4G190900 [Panicum hallii]|uniref:Uncharacterized protein n=1 Tax=Panicum hallii TaxID=206008 RepID=A0A2T8JDC8_9POAL|nr:hypothetical protein PAHAL_4G190900 [Panicum hallii]
MARRAGRIRVRAAGIRPRRGRQERRRNTTAACGFRSAGARAGRVNSQVLPCSAGDLNETPAYLRHKPAGRRLCPWVPFLLQPSHAETGLISL